MFDLLRAANLQLTFTAHPIDIFPLNLSRTNCRKRHQFSFPNRFFFSSLSFSPCAAERQPELSTRLNSVSPFDQTFSGDRHDDGFEKLKTFFERSSFQSKENHRNFFPSGLPPFPVFNAPFSELFFLFVEKFCFVNQMPGGIRRGWRVLETAIRDNPH